MSDGVGDGVGSSIGSVVSGKDRSGQNTKKAMSAEYTSGDKKMAKLKCVPLNAPQKTASNVNAQQLSLIKAAATGRS